MLRIRKLFCNLLDAVTIPKNMDIPSLNFHKLKGKYKNYYAVTVRANWRIIFQFKGENAILVNYLDYL